MLNYIRAELYRNFNRMYFWVFTGLVAALALTVTIIGRANNVPQINFSVLLGSSLYVLTAAVFIVVPYIDMVTAEENKHQTMRNVITFGVPRYKLILSKLIVSVILSFIAAFIIFGVFYGSAAALFGIDQGVKEVFPMVLKRILTAIPLWIGAVSIGTFLGMAINSNTIFSFVYGGLFLLTSKIFQLLSYIVSDKFEYLRRYLITNRLGALSDPKITANELYIAAFIGFAYTVVFAVLSVLYFNKKEIK